MMRALLVLAVISGSAHAEVMPANARQLIVGVTDDWNATHVTLRKYERGDHGWKLVGQPWQAVVGKDGLGWGNGLHGNGTPHGRSGPVKHEGDGKSPAGMFQLRGVYGYADKPPKGTQLPYTHVTGTWQCVDDEHSSHYTRIVDRDAETVDWKSSEKMKRSDELYTWVVDIAHNAGAVAGAGSCIFFHVWRGADSVTVGCTAMPERTLAKLIATLDPSAVYVLLPRDEYTALQPAWELPAL